MTTEFYMENYFKVALFISDYALGTTPCTITSAVLLAKAGYDVDIFVYRPHDDPAAVKFQEANIRVYDLTRFGGPEAVPAGEPFIPGAVLNAARKIIAGHHYVCFMGIESKGLIFAGLLQEQFRVPVIYFSTELYYTGHPHIDPEALQKIKPLERKYHARAIATIVQDEERGRILIEDNRVHPGKIFYVPVGLLGEPVARREKIFHRMFNLPESERILLQFGSIHPYRQSDRIAAISESLPDGWTLVLHGFIAPEIRDIVKGLNNASGIRLSGGLVPLEDLPSLVAAADVGLVFYTDDNLNDYNTGLASDKMARHMQCGSPVITCDFPGFRRVVDTYQCGVCVDDPARIPAALARIEREYDAFVQGTRRAYREQYEVSRHFKAVLDYLYQVSAPPPEVKHTVIRRYAGAHATKVLIETGTFMGDTLEALRDTFDKLYSIELSYPLFKKAGQRFAGDERIVLAQGDSARVLPELLARIDQPALFWLDGHYSGSITARGTRSTPIIEELQAIFNHRVKGHVILIDDARDFNGTGDYPTIEALADRVRSAGGAWRFRVSEGIIQIFSDPESVEAALSTKKGKSGSGGMDDEVRRLARGAALFQEGKLDGAEALFREILDQRADDIEALFGLAGVLWKKGCRKQARETLSMVLELAPDDRQVIRNLGRFLYSLGLHADACRVYSFFLNRHPGDDRMADALGTWRALEPGPPEGVPVHETVADAYGPDAECIIFSMDRAMQLHALLTSYFEKVTHPAPLHLLYRASSAAHLQGYKTVIALFRDRLASTTLQRETGDNPFRAQLLELLDGIKASRMFFLVDDIVFLEDTDLKDFTRFDTRRFVPSLRLGTQLTRCYTLDRAQPLPRFQKEMIADSDKHCWQWQTGLFDWRYPLSVDGHLFSTAEMRAMAGGTDFTSPNSFELGLQKFSDRFISRTGICYRKSRIVNIPCNRVQEDLENRHGGVHQDELMEMFNRGLQIDCRRLYGFVNNGAHQEIPLSFVQRPEISDRKISGRKISTRKISNQTGTGRRAGV